MKIKFPMPFNKFLRTVLPKVREPDRYVAWRKYLKCYDHAGWFVNDTDFSAIMKKLQDTGIPNEMSYILAGGHFVAWYNNWRKEETSRVRSKAGKKPKKNS
jgi:hypothetical protein